ncbi:hypothetical protein D3C83_223600 [compost metagenome]
MTRMFCVGAAPVGDDAGSARASGAAVLNVGRRKKPSARTSAKTAAPTARFLSSFMLTSER